MDDKKNVQLKIADLTYEYALAHTASLVELANLIPQVTYTKADILAQTKGNRQLHAKWEHGLVVVDKGDEPIAFIGAYERASENNEQYPQNSLYISELAVSEGYRKKGIARALVNAFFVKNNALSFVVLAGDLHYSVQTNAASWNNHVVDFYKSFGFQERSTKVYDDRIDVVLERID